MADHGNELRQLLSTFGVNAAESLSDDAPLISSGMLDSLGLLQLILWVESKTGRTIDPEAVDLARELDSIRLVLAYVGQAGAGRVVREDAGRPSQRAGEGIDIVRYTAAHKTAVAEFQMGLWSKDRDQNIRYLEWKYEDNPYTGEPCLYLAFQQDRLIGMRGFYASRWELGRPTRRHDILVADDLLIAENHRNQGFVHQIMQAALSDLCARGEALVFNLSGGPLTVLNSLAMGWKNVGRLEPIENWGGAAGRRRRIRLLLSSLPVLWRFSDHGMLRERAARNPFHAFDHHRGSHCSSNGVTIHLSAEPRPEQMARLVRQTGHDGRLRHVRDAAFLEWRLGNPLAEYRYCFAGEDSLDGYAILRISRAAGVPDSRVVIADIEAIDERTRAALLEAVVRPGSFEHLYAWSATLRTGDIGFLEKCGFTPAIGTDDVHAHPQILGRPTGDATCEASWCLYGVSLLEACNWDMRMIYSMAG